MLYDKKISIGRLCRAYKLNNSEADWVLRTIGGTYKTNIFQDINDKPFYSEFSDIVAAKFVKPLESDNPKRFEGYKYILSMIVSRTCAESGDYEECITPLNNLLETYDLLERQGIPQKDVKMLQIVIEGVIRAYLVSIGTLMEPPIGTVMEPLLLPDNSFSWPSVNV